MECKQCGNEFEAQRSTAQYCGAKCRKLAFQERPEKVSVPTMHEQQCAANNQTRPKADQHIVNTGPRKSFDELDKGEHNCVPLPGDDDYNGVVTEAMINSPCTGGVIA